MKFLYRISPLFFLLACTSAPETTKNEQEKNVQVRELRQRFEIVNRESYKEIHVFTDKNGADTTFSYVLYHRGSQKPLVNFKAMYIETPVEKAAVLSSLYIGCLEKLNLLNKIVAVDNKNYINNLFVQSKIEKGEIKEIAKTEQIDIEQTLLLKPDLIITYGMGNPETDINKKIVEAGIPMAISIDHLETSPLARANWIKFVAAFFEKDKMADSIAESIEKKYTYLVSLAKTTSTKPKILTEIKLNDTWFVPGGKSFMATLLKDAGSEYCWQDNEKTGSLALSYEEVYLKALEADYWLNLSGWNSLTDCKAQDERNVNFKAYKNKNLYNNNAILNKEGGNAYWETGLISPDEVLADLVKIFHPELLPEHTLKYYRKLN